MCGFVRPHLCISAQTAGFGTIAPQALADLMRNIAGATENIGGICFGIGSLIFFYLFLKSRFMPMAISGLGLFASVIWIVLYFANLVVPEEHALFQYICFPPMALADVISGFYLMLFGVSGR